MKDKVDYIIYTDGGARGNPGPAAYGFVVYDGEKNLIFEEGKTIGVDTNNVAEYSGVVAALKWIEQKSKIEKPNVQFFLDSQLVTMQLLEKWKIKNENLRSFFHTIKTLEQKIGGDVSYSHIRREENAEADKMVNMALDGGL